MAKDELDELPSVAAARARELSARIKTLEKIVDEQAGMLERQAKSKYRLPKASATPGSKCSMRLIVPDTHGSHADPDAMASFLSDVQALGGSIGEVVHLGDALDCGGFLAAHHTEHYVAETTNSFEDDVNATNQLFDAIQAACPKAVVHYLEGNHERRIEKWCVTQSLRNAKDAEFLRRTFCAGSVLHLAARGVNWYRQSEFYHGLPIPATIKLGHCYFTHGSRAGKSATSATLGDFGGCVVHGHTHTMRSDSSATVHSGGISAWCPGALCRLQPLWNHTQPTRWGHGYGIQLVNKDGTFLHINVPIGSGKSYLQPLLNLVKA